jgi:2-polyprenyl-3-methyl-5-hydroxy-6-metoxy-1,4-benzoquinol methylase
MDDPSLEVGEHHRALDGLRRINAISGTARKIAKQLRTLIDAFRLKQASILDVGCGSGDVVTGVARRLPASGNWHVEGWDMSSTAITRANEIQASRSQSAHKLARVKPVMFEQHNIFDEHHRVFDFVYCSLFLHHFSETQAIAVLERMRGLARYAVIIDDLDRSWWGYWVANIGVRLLSRSPVVHFDGPQSVRAAFTVGEAAFRPPRSKGIGLRDG